MRPFPNTFPELEILRNGSLSIEYRVYNYTLAKDGTNSLRRRTGYSFFDLLVLAAIYASWKYFNSVWVTGLLSLVFLRMKASQVLYESIVVLPRVGVQIESTRGLTVPFTSRTYALSTSRHFLASESIHDVIVNEGLRRWNWYYYLAILRRSSPRISERSTPYEVSMMVAFENILPPFEVVREVYHGVREALFDEFEQDS